MELRTLSPENYKNIIEIWKLSELPFRPLGRDSQPSIEKQMAIDPDMWLGCFIEGKLIGLIIGSYDSRKGWLNRLAVLPEHQGKGCAKALVEEMEDRLRKKGLSIFAVLIEDGHDRSLALFKKAGYEIYEGIHYLRKLEDPNI